MLRLQPERKNPDIWLFGQVLTKGLPAMKHLVEGKRDTLLALMNSLAG